jgi:hypothetical protein
MCAWSNDLRARFDTAIEHAVPAMAEIMPTLSAQQIASIEKRYAAKNDEYRDDFLHRDPAKRKKAATQREIERAEEFYGRLDDAQRAFVVRAIAESPWDGDMAYAERLRRQQDMLSIVRRLAANRASPVEAEAEIRGYLKRIERSPHEPYRRYLGVWSTTTASTRPRCTTSPPPSSGRRRRRSSRATRTSCARSPAKARPESRRARPGLTAPSSRGRVDPTRRGLAGAPRGKSCSAALNIAGSRLSVSELLPSLFARAS